MISKAQQRRNRQKWIKALRLGEYKQAIGTLKEDSQNAFCCLGVACELFRKEQIKRGVDCYWNGGVFYYNEWTFTGYLPFYVREWLGLISDNGWYRTKKGVERSLSGLNDYSKLSFKQIANIIEKEPEGLIES